MKRSASLAISGFRSSDWKPVMSASRPNGEQYQGMPAEMTGRPFQWMVSGFCCGEFGFVEPTAHTSLAAIAVTPVSSAGPFVFGADDSVQFAPSQCSINAFAPLMLPTAQTSLAETASTAASEPPWAFAPVTPVQDVP